MNKESPSDKNKRRKRRYKKEPLSQEKKVALVIVCAIVFVAVVFGVICLISGNLLSVSNPEITSTSEQTTELESTSEETTEAPTETTEETTEATSEETTEAPSSSSDRSYDYSSPVPQSAPVDDSYFSDAVFMGDSRTEGFALFSGLDTMTTYASRGLNVSTVFTDATIDLNGTMVTAIDALRNTSFSKLYRMFG